MSSEDIEAIVDLSLLAWAPVFASFRQVLGGAIFSLLYPDWQTSQRDAVESVCREVEKYHTYVAVVDGAVVGFVAYELNQTEQVGEVYMLAVHPAAQNQGVGSALNQFALEQMRAAGMKLAMVGTGGDPGHAPARRTYEKAGYTALPAVHYYQAL